jgi:hypothetical protein
LAELIDRLSIVQLKDVGIMTSATVIQCQGCLADPAAYLKNVLAKLINGWPMSHMDELLPWAYATSSQSAVA